MSTADRIREVLDAAEVPDRQRRRKLADLCDISPQAVAQWFSGDTKKISPEFLAKIARQYRVDLDWLITGKGVMRPEVNERLKPIYSWEQEGELPAGEYVYIPRLNVRLSAGNGQEAMEIDLMKDQPQAFRADWIREKQLKPASLACMITEGDSMEPRLCDGDSLLVDTSQTDIIDGKVYAIAYAHELRVKRLYKLPGGGVLIRSDNSAKYPEIKVEPSDAEHVRIVGRVVHFSGSL